TGTALAFDPDDTASFVTGDVSGTYGSFSIDTDGAWSYTLDNSNPATNGLDKDETSYDVFTVTAQDDNSATDTDVVTVTVVGHNDAPTITDTDTGSVSEDVTAASVATGTALAFDPDDTASFVTGDVSGTYGTFSIG